MTDQQERTPDGFDYSPTVEKLTVRIAALEAELDDTLKDAEDWERRAAANKRKLLVVEARIEHLEAALREVLQSPGDIHVVLDGIRRALTTSTEEPEIDHDTFLTESDSQPFDDNEDDHGA